MTCAGAPTALVVGVLIMHIATIESLQLPGIACTRPLLMAIARMPKLRALNLNMAVGLTDDDVELLGACPALQVRPSVSALASTECSRCRQHTSYHQ